jgi:hypothetical protein
MHYVLSSAAVNDTLVTVDSETLGAGLATYSLDLNNTGQGSYFLVEAAGLADMSIKNFNIDYNSQIVSMRVGSTHIFANGNSVKLSIIDATTDRLLADVSGDFIAPDSPINLTQQATGSTVALDWSDSSDNMAGINEYTIEYATNNLFADATRETSITSNINLNLTGITGVTTYYWRVMAQDNAENLSTWSEESSFIVTPADIGANSYKTANDIATLDNWVGFGDPADYYKLTMTSAGTLTLNLTGLSGDANLSLLDSDGKILKTSANKGNTSEAITNYLLAGGTYYVNVAPVKGVNSAAYTLANTKNYFPADTAGNTFALAQPVTESGPVNEWLGFGDKDDYYMFELQASTAVTLDLTGLESNVNMYLYDSKNKQLAASAKSGNTDESITKTLAAGKYYVKATLAGKDNTDYSLNFGIDPSAFKVGSLQLSSAASPLTGSADTTLGDTLKKDQGLLAS